MLIEMEKCICHIYMNGGKLFSGIGIRIAKIFEIKVSIIIDLQ